MSLEINTAPAVEPLTVLEAKDHCRAIEETAGIEDAWFSEAIKAARQYVDGRDGILGRQLITATWDLTLDEFPITDQIFLPLAPAQSITSITYTDADGNGQTLSSSLYGLSADKDRGPSVNLAYGESWPGTRGDRDAVTVTYVAGYGEPADVPAPVRAAMLLIVGHLYENREESISGTIINEIPLGVEELLAPYHRYRCL